MSLLSDWDELVHGAIVFAAGAPFALTLVPAVWLPEGKRWLAALVALRTAMLWFFGWPDAPPAGSDDVPAWALLAFALGAFAPARLRWAVMLSAAAVIAWLVYPAWLAGEGGLARKLAVVAGVGATAAAMTGLADGAGRRLTPVAYLPTTVALAVLLQLGGALRFGQASGAVGAMLAAVAVVMVWRKADLKEFAPAVALAAAMLAVLAWSGWLFAGLRWGLALIVLAGPGCAFVASYLPIGGKGRWGAMVRDGLAASVAAAPPAVLAVIDYVEQSSEFEGY